MQRQRKSVGRQAVPASWMKNSGAEQGVIWPKTTLETVIDDDCRAKTVPRHGILHTEAQPIVPSSRHLEDATTAQLQMLKRVGSTEGGPKL